LRLKGVSYASYVVDFFTEEGVVEFLGLQLDDMNRSAPVAERVHHRTYRDAFDEAIRLLFDALAKAVAPDVDEHSWVDVRIRSFLGYAPVLSVLARYLRVGNYQALCEELRSSPSWFASNKSAWLATLGRCVLDS